MGRKPCYFSVTPRSIDVRRHNNDSKKIHPHHKAPTRTPSQTCSNLRTPKKSLSSNSRPEQHTSQVFRSVDSNIYLCVDPELIQEVKLYVNGKDCGRNNEGHRNVENLGREEETDGTQLLKTECTAHHRGCAV